MLNSVLLVTIHIDNLTNKTVTMPTVDMPTVAMTTDNLQDTARTLMTDFGTELVLTLSPSRAFCYVTVARKRQGVLTITHLILRYRVVSVTVVTVVTACSMLHRKVVYNITLLYVL